MSRKFLTAIDLAQNELLNCRLQNLGSAPGSPVEGQIYYDTASHKFQGRTNSAWVDMQGGGSVSSVALTLPASVFSVAGSPVTSSGTLAGSFVVQTQNTVFAGPTSGADAAPTFRALVAGDIPSLNASKINAGQLALAQGGTHADLSATGGSGFVLKQTSAGADVTVAALVAGDIPSLTAAKISDFDTQVRTSRLDQMAAPTASVAMNSQRLTGLSDPSSAQDAATKAYVDAARNGLDVKDSVRVATAAALPANTRSGNVLTASANASINSAGVDGVTNLALNDRVLVKNEATGANNGLYSVTALGSGAAPWTLTRTTDADASAEVTGGLFVFVEEGSTNADSGWVMTNDGAVTLNTTALTFVQFSGAGQITASAPLSKSGNTLSLSLAARLVNNGGSLDLASGVATAGTYTSVTVDTYGRVTAGADVVTSNGLVARTASGTFAARTLTGTASRLSVANGDGVSGNPTVDIDSAYVGQTSITTLGTVATGTWSATTIALNKGGTGATTAPTARANLGAAGKYTALVGNGSSTSVSVTQATHGLASDGSMVAAVYDASTGDQVECDVTINNANGTVTFAFATAPASNAYRVVIIG
jgi:hypothetical protein